MSGPVLAGGSQNHCRLSGPRWVSAGGSGWAGGSAESMTVTRMVWVCERSLVPVPLLADTSNSYWLSEPLSAGRS